MNKILTIQQIEITSTKLKEAKEKIILIGGCFDILHIGHIEFLEKAKALEGKLLILLESDQSIKRLKGENRPIHNQKERAKVLSKLEMVDYVVLLPPLKGNNEYKRLIELIKPTYIAITADDPLKNEKIKQAEFVTGKVVEVVERKANNSSTRILKSLGL